MSNNPYGMMGPTKPLPAKKNQAAPIANMPVRVGKTAPVKNLPFNPAAVAASLGKIPKIGFYHPSGPLFNKRSMPASQRAKIHTLGGGR